MLAYAVRVSPTFLIFAATAAAQDFRYEFHDTPSPEADVVVRRHTLRQGPGADLYLVGSAGYLIAVSSRRKMFGSFIASATETGRNIRPTPLL